MTVAIAPTDETRCTTPQLPRSTTAYAPLPGEDWTRILELHPGAGPLSCTLQCTRIDDAASNFEALSYVWGRDAQTNTIDIDCDGRTLSVGVNLAGALLQIRHETTSKRLWADAVRINQKDKNEQSQQVQRMGNIFTQVQ
jgi:hypothetical protein